MITTSNLESLLKMVLVRYTKTVTIYELFNPTGIVALDDRGCNILSPDFEKGRLNSSAVAHLLSNEISEYITFRKILSGELKICF